MSKIYYRKGGSAEKNADTPAAKPSDGNALPEKENTEGARAVADEKENAAAKGTKKAFDEAAAAETNDADGALNGASDADAASENIAADIATDGEDFDKDRLMKYFRRHPKKSKVNTRVERYSPDLKSGLTSAQVQTRFSQFLFNDTNKKYSKSYASIFVGNICTFSTCCALCLYSAHTCRHARSYQLPGNIHNHGEHRYRHSSGDTL